MVRIENKKRGTVKYEWDEEFQALRVDRFLYGPEHYIFNYGEIIGHQGGDGDLLDAVVLTEHKLEAACILECSVLGMLITHDEKGRDEKIILVPCEDPDLKDRRDITDISKGTLDKIEQFFKTYKHLEPGKWVEVEGFKNRDEAWHLIKNSRNVEEEKKVVIPFVVTRMNKSKTGHVGYITDTFVADSKSDLRDKIIEEFSKCVKDYSDTRFSCYDKFVENVHSNVSAEITPFNYNVFMDGEWIPSHRFYFLKDLYDNVLKSL